MKPHLLLIVFQLLHCAHAYLLNVPQVLLPYYLSEPINFTLKVTEPPGACFQWKSSRPDVVSLFPLLNADLQCSDSVIVSAITKHPHKQTAIVFAQGHGVTLRCDVMVDVIDSIEIVSTTRELFLEVAPEMFTVTAKNDMDDTFTTLAGLPFDWDIKSGRPGQTSLRVIPWAESVYQTPPAIMSLEEKGLKGHQCLMEGIGTGSSILQVKLKDIEYKNIPPYSITLIVVANLVLLPSEDIYVPVHAYIHYSVNLIKQHKIQDVPLPSDQYSLELSDNNIASLDSQSSIVEGLAVGKTEIKLMDRHVDSAHITRLPSAYIYVTNPTSLHFGVNPGNVFVLETGREYEIYLQLKDNDQKMIFVTQNMRLNAEFPATLFEILEKTENGSFYRIKTLSKGETVINGVYESITKLDGSKVSISPPISKSQRMEIFDKIDVQPEIVAFPHHPEIKAVYSHKYEASGGSGDFSWSLTPRNMGSIVESTGLVTSSNVLGQAVITANDNRNRMHKGMAKLLVMPVTRLSFISQRVEVRVGSRLNLQLQAFGVVPEINKEIAFTKCQNMPIKTTLSNDNTFKIVPADLATKLGIGCMILSVEGLSPGESTVRVIYESLNIEATIIIMAYPILKLDTKADPLLALGSSWTVRYSGGPRPWGNNVAKHTLSVGEEDRAVVLFFNTETSAFIVQCLHDQKSVKVMINVSNQASKNNPEPAVEIVELRVCCAIPETIRLQPRLPELGDGFDECPLINQQNPIYSIHKSDKCDLLISGYGRCSPLDLVAKFDNISSLMFEWQATPNSMLNLPIHNKLVEEQASVVIELKGFGSKGKVDLKATSTQYLTAIQKTKHSLRQSISGSISLDLVDYASVSPSSISLFNHPSITGEVSLIGGSGYVNSLEDKSIDRTVEVSFSVGAIKLSPLRPGLNIPLNIYDICMITRPKTYVTLDHSVVAIMKIVVEGPNMVELNREVELNVVVFDSLGNPLPTKHFKFIHIQFLTASDVINFKSGSAQSESMRYNVSGVRVGVTNIVVTATQADAKIVTSAQHAMQVFAPLQVAPKDVFLVTESLFQLEIRGGPQPVTFSNIEYSMNETGIVQVNNGMVKSMTKLGHVSVTAKLAIKGIGLYTQAIMNVHVISLHGLRIKAPTLEAFVGTELPLMIVGLGKGESPYCFGGAQYPIKFQWKVNYPEIGALQETFHGLKVGESMENDFAKRLALLTPGHVTITLKATAHSDSKHHFVGGKSVVFTDSITVQVMQSLRNIVPSVQAGKILMAPESSLQIRMNKPNAIGSVPANDANISIDKNGILRSSKIMATADLVQKIKEHDIYTQKLLVQVQPVSYLMLQNDIQMETGSTVVLPLGMPVNMTVQFHHAHGDLFHAVDDVIQYRPNRFDLTEISLNEATKQISIQLKQKGTTVLKVWSSTHSDYVRLTAGEIIAPDSITTITVGDLICFESNLKCENQAWKSSDKTKVKLDVHSGIGQALSSGNVKISTQFCHDQMQSFVELTILPPSGVKFHTSTSKFVSNVGKQTDILLPVFVMANSAQKTNFHGRNCDALTGKENVGMNKILIAFDCELSWKNEQRISAYSIFSVDAEFNENMGTPVCRVKSLPLDTVESHSTIDSELLITARLRTVNQSSSIHVPFYPSMHVHHTSLTIDYVQNMYATLSIGVPNSMACKLEVTPSDPSIKVRQLSAEGSVAKFSVSHSQSKGGFIARGWSVQNGLYLTELYVTVRHPLSGETKRVQVTVQNYGHAPKQVYMAYNNEGLRGVLWFIVDEYSLVFTVLFTFIVSMLCFIAGYKILSVTSTPLGVANVNGVNNGVIREAKPTPEYTNWRTYNSPRRLSPKSNVSSPGGSPYLWSRDSAQTSPYYRPN